MQESSTCLSENVLIENSLKKLSKGKLISTYSKYKNLHGQISPMIIVFNTYINELQLMSPKKIAKFAVEKIKNLNDTFKEAKIKSEIYDYTTNYLNKFEFEMNRKRNTTDALLFFSNAILKGDGLSANLELNEKDKKEKDKKERYKKTKK